VIAVLVFGILRGEFFLIPVSLLPPDRPDNWLRSGMASSPGGRPRRYLRPNRTAPASRFEAMTTKQMTYAAAATIRDPLLSQVLPVCEAHLP
jgi:hypothetical protein